MTLQDDARRCVAMLERLEVRLETNTKRQLEHWAHTQNISLAEAVRQIIQERLGIHRAPATKPEAARLLLNVGLSDLPEPDTLEEEIHSAFGE
jgi:hypothetical protein